MKKRYIIPAFDIVFVSPSLDVLLVAESYPVNPYDDGTNYTIGGEEDDPPANQVSFSLWDEE